MTEHTLEVDIDIDAPPEVVFPFLVDAEKLTKWMGTDAKTDPVPGGVYRVDLNGKSDRFVALGEFVEIDPPRRVVFTFGWDGNDGLPAGSTLVEITCTPIASGTNVRLVHSNLPDANAVVEHRGGWSTYAERLKVATEGGDPGPDPMVDAS